MFDKPPKLVWEAVSPFGNTHYISGIYKLTAYTYYKGAHCPKYWRAYMVMPNQENWGDFVPGNGSGPGVSLSEAKAICAAHAATYMPTNKQIKVAARSHQNMARQEND